MFFVSPFTEMWKFQRPKDCGYTFHLRIDYADRPVLGLVPYQAECGVISSLSWSRSSTTSVRINEKWLYTFAV